MQGTTNFGLVKEAQPTYARRTVFNEFADQIDSLLLTFQREANVLVQLRNLLDDSDQGGAPPVGPSNGEGFVVNNWGAGNYVGTYVGAFADSDLAEYSDALGGFVRVLANDSGLVPVGTKCIVGVGAAGSFAAQDNNLAEFNGLWAFTVPTDGQPAIVIGEQTYYENEQLIFDSVTKRWVAQGKSDIRLSNIWVVDKSGNDTTGSGSFDKPFLTIGGAQGSAGFAAGDTILVGPGTYAETLAITGDINIVEMVRGTVTIQNTVVGGAVVTVTPGATNANVRIGASIVNASNASAADIALQLDNSAATGNGNVHFTGALLDGGANGTALSVLADPLAVAFTEFYADHVEDIVGGLVFDLYNPLDYVHINNAWFSGGATAWMDITGDGGRVILSNCLLPIAANTETINYGNGAACGVGLDIGSSVITGVLDLNNLGGTGIVVLTAGTQIGSITASQNDQIVQKWLGEDEFKVTMYNIDVNPGAPPVTHDLYTVGAGRRFAPHTARTINRGAATGAALNYQYNGSGAGSVVGAVGAGALAQGIANEVVTQDAIGPAGVLQFEVLAASGNADSVDAEVIGRLF